MRTRIFLFVTNTPDLLAQSMLSRNRFPCLWLRYYLYLSYQ